MIQMLRNLFSKQKINVDLLLANGAVIVDVRTEAEFASGHKEHSRNIPLAQLPQATKQLPKDKAIILCCASGMRSAAAKEILLRNGFKEVYNIGSWTKL